MSRVPRTPFTETKSSASLDQRKDSRPPTVKLYLGRCPRLSTVTSRLNRPCRDSQSLHSRLRTVHPNKAVIPTTRNTCKNGVPGASVDARVRRSSPPARQGVSKAGFRLPPRKYFPRAL